MVTRDKEMNVTTDDLKGDGKMGRQRTEKGRILYRIVLLLIVFSLLSNTTLQMSHAKTEEPPEEYRGKTITSVG